MNEKKKLVDIIIELATEAGLDFSNMTEEKKTRFDEYLHNYFHNLAKESREKNE